jgi:hypothetical protein
MAEQIEEAILSGSDLLLQPVVAHGGEELIHASEIQLPGVDGRSSKEIHEVSIRLSHGR